MLLLLYSTISIHKSKEAKIMIKRLWFKVIYFPDYSPKFTPIEMILVY